MTAAWLPTLCLNQILECLEEDKEDNASALHSCILVNWHWCRHSIPYLWREPFPSRKQRSLPSRKQKLLLATVAKCVNKSNKKRRRKKKSKTAFPYLSYIQTLNFQVVSQGFNYAYSIGMMQFRDPTKSLTNYCSQIINGPGVIFELNMDFEKADNIAEQYELALEKYDWADPRWDFFNMSGASMSLRRLKKLTICHKSATHVLPLVNKVCRQLQEMNIVFYPRTSFDIQCDLESFRPAINHLSHLHNLKELTLSDGEGSWNVTESTDDFLAELGRNLPQTMQRLTVKINLEFTVESLRQFLQNLSAPLTHLCFPEAEFIGDEHLLVFGEFSRDTLKTLDLREAQNITKEVYEKINKKIPHINVYDFYDENDLYDHEFEYEDEDIYHEFELEDMFGFGDDEIYDDYIYQEFDCF